MSERLLLEVLKFLDPASLLQGAALSCKSWHRASKVEEVWQSLSEAFDFGPQEEVTWKLHFKSRFFADQIKFLANFHHHRLSIFSCKDDLFVHSMDLALIGKNSSLVLASPTEVILCGGAFDDSGRIAVLCDVKRGSVTRLPDMSVSRRFHSVLVFRRTVYVFGGCGAMAEKLGLTEKQWKRLPNMLYCRIFFNACRRGMSVYLCGGDTKRCERFLIEHNCFVPLPFSLKSSSSSTAFLYKGKIVVLSNNWLYYVSGSDMQQKRKVSCDLSHKIFHTGTSSPAVRGTQVYFCHHHTDTITIFDMETHATKWCMHSIEC